MRIAVYGGSFNPPHPAHVRAARLAYEALQPDNPGGGPSTQAARRGQPGPAGAH